ncbi:MAG TPA: transglutaminase-like domain-containing protein [Planctomycetaceae bacterium]|nr:transglutaminase-like domain-containing protein [Planctomycetaceae bacterium]
MRFTAIVWCVISSVCMAGEEQILFDQWQVMTIDKARVGYAHLEIRRTSEGVIKATQQSHLRFKRFGDDVKLETILTTEEEVDGTLISFRYEEHNPPNNSKVSFGEIDRSLFRLGLTVAGHTSHRAISRPAELKSSIYQDRMFFGKNMKPGMIEQFSVWQPELSKAGNIKFRVDDRRYTKLFDGTNVMLFKVFVTNPLAPSLNLRGYVDERGRWLKSEADFAGKILTTYAVSAEEALEELAGGELDLALSSIVKVKGLRNPHEMQEVVYRIKTKAADPARYFPSDPSQHVEPIDDETIQLTVRKVPAPPRSVVVVPQAEEFLAATDYLQSDDRGVIELAHRAAAGIGTDPLRIAVSMESTVRERIHKKMFSSALASAAEVAQSREGDCTEHAMLLAAMLRAARIPSRVAVGFSYEPRIGGFIGHMWTEAWIRDRWVPLDATLESGKIGAGYIKLSDSSLGENTPSPIIAFLPMMELLGKMQIEVVQQR